MYQQYQFPALRSIAISIVILVLAVSMTLLSFKYQGSKQINVGNLCGANRDQPCLVSIPKAGWLLPYIGDMLGTSAMGVLGFENFRIISFLLDLLFFVLLLSGAGWLFNRIGLVRLL
jgi:hypothetical protein